jgi:hypothetical protein
MIIYASTYLDEKLKNQSFDQIDFSLALVSIVIEKYVALLITIQ